jgi:hypothetical protein
MPEAKEQRRQQTRKQQYCRLPLLTHQEQVSVKSKKDITKKEQKRKEEKGIRST